MKPLLPLPYFFLLFFVITNTFCENIATAVHGRCVEDQQLSLLHLKKRLSFDTESSEYQASSKFISWNSSTDCCSWAGVTCNTNGSVVGLDISSQYISGGIDSSSSLFHLQHLQSLNLADNSFVDGSSIPSSIGKLTNLSTGNSVVPSNIIFTPRPEGVEHVWKPALRILRQLCKSDSVELE